MRIDHVIRLDPHLLGRLDRIESALEILLVWSRKMSVEVDRLIASADRNIDQSDSIVAYLHGIAQLIRDNVDNSEKLIAVADRLDRSTEREAAAMLNTTGEPTPTPVTEPVPVPEPEPQPQPQPTF